MTEADTGKDNAEIEDGKSKSATTHKKADSVDDFGLPVKKKQPLPVVQRQSPNMEEVTPKKDEGVRNLVGGGLPTLVVPEKGLAVAIREKGAASSGESSDNDEFEDARSGSSLGVPPSQPSNETTPTPSQEPPGPEVHTPEPTEPRSTLETLEASKPSPPKHEPDTPQDTTPITKPNPESTSDHKRGQSATANGVSEWSHQQLAPHSEYNIPVEEDEWQTMPAYAPFDMYDDDNRLVAREHVESDDGAADAGLGGAGKGYTRVQLDEDAQSATSLDENTRYLFKEANGTSAAGQDDEETRDAVSQMQATKDLLTEGQRIAYVGMTRLALSAMLKQVESLENLTKRTKKETAVATEATKMWSQKMMVRLYSHMEISSAEQIMIEQLAEHGVEPGDLTPTLMQNSRVKNPMAERPSSTVSRSSISLSPRPGSISSMDKSGLAAENSMVEEEAAPPPPAYVEHEGEDLPEVRTPSQLPTTKNIDIDLRWTVLCDLFLTLVADSVYDARSRVLLEEVGRHMDVASLEICRFEKRVTDALEMQQAAEKENWNEDDHKETRRKMALKKRFMYMGLATVGGSLVIGLSAGLLAPVIGAGLAAGFTTIGVAGTGTFLAGAGGAAIITSGAAASGGIIAVRAANRRTGAVKTFEYRPLHNNKRVNLIVTVSGWMTGKVDDVRLPYSTIDPIMGDIYSVLWEPEMLTSMGDTINILATEALTQGLQQVLGSTILIGLMAALQLPVVLTKLAYLIDNPWTVSLDRANMAGLILADSLIDRNLGTRPITFVGYSLGSRVIFSCLRELARKGAYGLVQNVYLFGSPIVATKDEYIRARSVVAGRFVNGFARNDWILGYLFRLTSGGISKVSGLAPIAQVPGIENVDVTELVPGHMSYRTAMPRLLREVGWAVESDEFSEIEDPDPDNHQQRQRELINEIEEARKEAEKQELAANGKGKFGIFSRKKKIEKKNWETYQESTDNYEDDAGRGASESREGGSHGVLFDIDAIRAELASENMQVKELQSTLPPMRLDLSASPISPRTSQALGQRKSHSYSTSQLNGAYTAYEEGPSYPTYGESEVRMSFDPENENSVRSLARSKSQDPPSHYSGSPVPPPKDTDGRLNLRSANTLPVGLGLSGGAGGAAQSMNLNHNAWADEEDEEFGKEQEIEMSFA